MRNVFAGSENDGKLLLRCVRAYVELDMLASFDLHTDQTITFGRAVLDRFVKLANVRHSFYIWLSLMQAPGMRTRGMEFSKNAPRPTPL